MKRLILAGMLLLLLCGCQPKTETQTAYFFDTVVSITLPDDADPALFNGCWKRCSEYELRFDRFSEESDLGHLLPQIPTVVDDETATVIQTALNLSTATNGAFDIRLGALSDLWSTDTLPDPRAIETALTEALATAVTVEENRVQVDGTGRLDLGGIAKGYVADRLADYLRQEGVSSAILNLGGNVYCLGDKQGSPFAVGIDTLMSQPDPPRLALRNQAADTAGTNQRYQEIDGTRYHHILDPKTGAPAKTDLVSATIIADSAATADALATACIVLGNKKAEELLKAFPDVSAVLVRDDGGVVTIRNPEFVNSAQK